MNPLPIAQMINNQMEELGIDHRQLIHRLGYSHDAKAERRMQELLSGNFGSISGVQTRLAAAIGIPESVLIDAIEQSKAQIAMEVDRAWRAAFKPSCIIETEQNGQPRQIFMAAIVNAMQYVVKEFPTELPEEGYLPYVIKNIDDWLIEVRKFFYAPTGFVINWTTDKSSRYLLSGSKVCDFDKAIRGGSLGMSLK